MFKKHYSNKNNGYLFIICIIIPLVIILKLNEIIKIETKNLIKLEKHIQDVRFIKRISKEMPFLNGYFDSMKNYENMTRIYIVSPVKMSRRIELANLVKMKNTLSLVPKLCWILVENSLFKSPKLAEFLESSDLEYIHLNHSIEFDEFYSDEDIELTLQNVALNWLTHNTSDTNAVVHFIQIDNTYDIKIFEEMRKTVKVSVWPVAFVNNSIYHGPICKNNKFVSWFDLHKTNKSYLIDSSEFAFNLNNFKTNKKNLKLNLLSKKPYDDFVNKLVDQKKFEPRANQCTKIYVWKTRTSQPSLTKLKFLLAIGINYDKQILNQV